MRDLARASFAVLCAAGLVGCASDKDDKSAMQERQETALKDPFSYGPTSASPGVPQRGPKPQPGQPQQQPAAAPGRDESAKSDWDRFWNP